jgi:peptidoglycan/LPS O-acetylase OafA/YrhL
MSESINRHYNVDFLKFVFVILIIIFHCARASWGDPVLADFPGFRRGNVCVDFFFIIGGFFLFSLMKEEDTFSFIKKKFFRLAPLLWAATLILYIMSLFFSQIEFVVTNNVLRCLLLTHLGLLGKGQMISSIPWFVSVYFWVSIFYFYLNKLVTNKKALNFTISLIIYIGFILYIKAMGAATTGGVSKVSFGFINIGVLRGLIGFGIGYIIAMIYKSKFLFNVSKIGRIFISFTEILIVYFMINHLVFNDHMPGGSLFTFSFLFSILFYCFLIKKGIISALLDNKWLGHLGKYSYAIYTIHWIVIKFFQYVVYDHHTQYYSHHQMTLILYITVASLVLSFFLHHLLEKPAYKYLRNKFCTKNSSD